MKKVDVSTPEGKILWESYIELTKALANIVENGLTEERGYPDQPIVVTLKVWPYQGLSFQVKITDEGFCELWELEE